MNVSTAEAPPEAAPSGAEQGDRREGAAAEERGTAVPLLEQLETLCAAACTLGISLKRFFGALGQLLLAESRVARHGLPLFFIGTIALIALAVSLWICSVALIGWALAAITHSVGIALGILVLGHLALVIGLWFALKRGVRQASFPQSRAELRTIGRQLTQNLGRETDPSRTSAETPP